MITTPDEGTSAESRDTEAIADNRATRASDGAGCYERCDLVGEIVSDRLTGEERGLQSLDVREEHLGNGDEEVV